MLQRQLAFTLCIYTILATLFCISPHVQGYSHAPIQTPAYTVASVASIGLLNSSICRKELQNFREAVDQGILWSLKREVVLPKGADVIIALIRMHRDEKYWLNPSVFYPDRFFPERIKDCESFYYASFSDGRRNCIGMKNALISMKVILANLIRTFVFKVNKRI